jgi:glycosyltransferase involved in cell wall biosynthesis
LSYLSLPKLGFFSKSFGGFVGSSQSSLDVLKILIDCNYKVVVTSQRFPFRANNGLTKDLLKLRWFPPTKNHSLKNDLSLWRNLKTQVWRYLAYFAYSGSKLVLVDSLGSHEIFYPFRSFLKSETAIIVRESPDFFKNGLNKKNFAWAVDALNTYDKYIFVSRICQEKWMRSGITSRKQSFYIPNCCREDLVEQIRKETRLYYRRQLQLPLNDFLVVCIASVQPRKGHDLIINAMDRLLKEIPSISVYMIGPIITEWGQKLRAQIDQMGPTAKIKMLDKRTNALEYVYAADLLVLPSRAEAMPRTILEAMAIETAVAASDVDGIPELIDHEQTGLMFKKDDVEGLIQSISKIAHFPTEAERFRKAAKMKYWSNFSRNHQTQRFKLAFDEMINN